MSSMAATPGCRSESGVACSLVSRGSGKPMARYWSRHRLSKGVRLTPLCLLLFAQTWLSGPCQAQQPSTEYAVKAAFVLNFAKFTEWPATAFSTAQSPMEVCVLGKDPFGKILDDVL